jgi:hypothetical protein
MKTERENYFKPQTIMEQVAMEQGICTGSIIDSTAKNVNMTSAAQGYVEVNDGFVTDDAFSIIWE